MSGGLKHPLPLLCLIYFYCAGVHVLWVEVTGYLCGVGFLSLP